MLATVLTRLFGGIKGRILADATARVWGAVLSFALVPVYLSFVGVEAYGIVGAFVSIQTLLALLDFGFGASLTRELARTSGGTQDWARARNITRTLEVVYWGFAAVPAIIFALLVPTIADNWLNPEKLTPDYVRRALYVGAVAIAVQWAGSLYSGGLLGLQKQPLLAVVGITGATLRAVATVFVLWAISPTVEAMFWVQAATSLANSLVLRWLLWANMPQPERRATFQPALLPHIWQSATGLGAIALTSMVMMQADKVVLSKILSLEQFGYYMLATALASAIIMVIAPIYAAIFPRLATLVAEGNSDKLVSFYHTAGQIMACAVIPLGATVMFFSWEIAFAWTGEINIADQIATIAALLAIGHTLNGITNVPCAAQQASGWTSLINYSNLIAITVYIPSVIALAAFQGGRGAAIAWVLLMVGFAATGPVLMHQRLLKGEFWQWLWEDTALPLAVALLVAYAFRAMLAHPATRLGAFTMVASIMPIVLVATLVVCGRVLTRVRQITDALRQIVS